MNTAMRILRDECARLSELERDGLRALGTGTPWAAAPLLALQLVEIDREREELIEALDCLEAGGLWTPDERTGDLFAEAS